MAAAVTAGIPVPAYSAALAFYDAYRTERLPANMIQAQFGKINNWPMGAALSISMMIIVAIFSVAFIYVSRKVAERIE